MRLLSKIIDSKTNNVPSSYTYTTESYSINKSSSYKHVPSSAPSTPLLSWPSKSFDLRKSSSINEVLKGSRGFKPSDMKDPSTSQFLQSLTKRVFKVGLDENMVPAKKIDLKKIFTPADGEQIKPSNCQKVFASSAFYEKGFHPTVEDKIKLANRISKSMLDISNQSSKGQSMFVKRMKRSVKWVHEGEGCGDINGQELSSNGSDKPKDPLKLFMNPYGQVHDINSLRKQGYNVESALSPEIAQEIVRGLNSPKGKGAELFAKRRERSEKWVVGETNGTRKTPLPKEIPPTPVPLSSPVCPPINLPPPSYLPETVERLQHKQKLDGIQQQFNRPRVKLIKSPWDAALETGSVEAAFVEEPTWPTKGNYVAPAVSSYEAALKSDNLDNWSMPNNQTMFSHNPTYNSSSINTIIDNYQKGLSNVDVYKPAMPQGWATHKQFGSHRYCQMSTKIQKRAVTEEIKRSPSPFPDIPDITLNPELIDEPINTYCEARERPPSPFPHIPDVLESPELVETKTKEVASDLYEISNIPQDVMKNEDYKTNLLPSSIEDINKNVPYKIPNIFTYLDQSKDTKFYRPVSPIPPSKKSETNDAKHEFNFALPDLTVKILESSINTNARSLQSEIFESQGHFNAGRSCSPFPIYVPKYEPPSLKEEEKQFPNEEKYSTRMIIEPVKPKDPKFEEHMKKVALSADKSMEETVMLQKGCFNEFREKKISKNQKTIEEFSGSVQVQVDNDDVSTQNDDLNNLDTVKNEIYVKDTKPVENNTSFEEKSKTSEQSFITSSISNESVTENDKQKSSPPRNEPEPRKFKKAPETIIGAKPIFGQLNINSEFQKAIIGRQQSIQAKRLKQASENVPRSNGVKIENIQTEKQEKIDQNSKLATEIKQTEVADIEMLYPSEHEEIEKINYAQEREIHIDFQKIGDKIMLPIEPQSFSNFQEFIQNQYQEEMQPLNQYIDIDQEEYRKIPVRSLINTFEQSVTPHLKYKQLRDPLPDVLEKITPSQKYSLNSSRSLDSFNEAIKKVETSQSEQDMTETSSEMSATMYHVANVEVKTQYFPPDQSRMQIIEPSENSSFCKYTSSSSSNEAFQPIDDNNQNEGSNTLPRTKPKSASPSYQSTSPYLFQDPGQTQKELKPSYNYEPNQISKPPKPAIKLNLSNLQNYNVAPRGWTEAINYYKPLNISPAREMYSDF